MSITVSLGDREHEVISHYVFTLNIVQFSFW